MKAQKTLDLIETTFLKDSGDTWKTYFKAFVFHLPDIFRTNEQPRGYLGASIIAHECARYSWYSFRWYVPSNPSARLLRLFNRGHLEEARILALLKMIGCKIYQGPAFKEGLFGGTCDGILTGLPELQPDVKCLLEMKTHNDKSFTELNKKGVKLSKFEHYVQMQVYMKKFGLEIGLYFAVNKNNDDIYAEYVEIDHELCAKLNRKAELIIHSKTPLAKISESEAFWKCRWCPYADVCHHDAKPNISCRSCKFWLVENGESFCQKHKTKLDIKEQMTGCSDYEI